MNKTIGINDKKTQLKETASMKEALFQSSNRFLLFLQQDPHLTIQKNFINHKIIYKANH